MPMAHSGATSRSPGEPGAETCGLSPGTHLSMWRCVSLCRVFQTSLWCVHRCLIECRDEYKYNVEAVELLIRNHLVNMQQYDLHLAQVCASISHPFPPRWGSRSGSRALCCLGCHECCLLCTSPVSLASPSWISNVTSLWFSQSMENGLHYMAVAFAMQLVKLLLVDERSVSHVTEADFFHSIETLMRTCAHSRANAPEG